MEYIGRGEDETGLRFSFAMKLIWVRDSMLLEASTVEGVRHDGLQNVYSLSLGRTQLNGTDNEDMTEKNNQHENN